MGEHDSLKTPPDNLKDAIDWLALVGGGFGGTINKGWSNSGKQDELGTAFKRNPEFSEAKKQAFDDKEPEGLIYALADKLGSRFMGHMSQGGGFDFTGDKGIILNGRNYTTKYHEATWDGSDDAKNMARIFLCAATIAFLGLSFLCWKCKQTQGGWNGGSLTGSGTDPLGFFMTTMGYQSNYLDSGKKGSAVASLLEDDDTGFDGLVQPATKNIYDNFVQTLEYTYKPALDALSSPLTACYKFAKLYFTSQFTKSQGTRIDGTLEQIKEALKTFKSSCGYSAPDLSEQIGGYIRIAMTLPPSVPTITDPSPSHVGPVAGTLTSLGLGGAKTLVNGLLKIG
ncbi:uncharacterized protein BcabD6B2_42940 [Babesia caballi]|uniref:Uncharacterized protein n=1 Tax=Babesia caballi TaxID=5871 RepID=A0AAV4M223_BABCB|nr:hypothetical protein, conserved [Babesia caballi]